MSSTQTITVEKCNHQAMVDDILSVMLQMPLEQLAQIHKQHISNDTLIISCSRHGSVQVSRTELLIAMGAIGHLTFSENHLSESSYRHRATLLEHDEETVLLETGYEASRSDTLVALYNLAVKRGLMKPLQKK
ncbi:hypothetical protein [Vibrio owensii]|uniref:hypothetical protein n=1 Tax=Vibrio harveyi group TaxID=717610 RepID=UPI003CC55D8A